jgi:hypothetical protein
MAAFPPEADKVYPLALVPARRLSIWRWLAPFALLAAAFRLLPALISGAVETPSGSQSAPFSQGPEAGQTFPGSAYFFADGAFDAHKDGSLAAPWRDNRHILAIDIGPPAAPYRFTGRSAIDRMRALSCLTNAIYYEAGNEPEEGQRAVAQVVLNRLRHPDWPDSICGVVYQGTERADLRCQFTFSCDGSMARVPDGPRWSRARRVAQAALSGEVFAPAGLATFYHTLTVFPSWANRMRPAAIIGAHIFYRTPGSAGESARFADRYTGIEAIAGPSANAFLTPGPDHSVAPLIPALPVDATPSPPPLPAAIVTPVPQAPPPGVAHGLPQSGDIKPEYRNSGRPLD